MNIIFENSDFLVIDKPSGLVVHPGAGKEKETVVSWFIDQYPGVKNLPWPDPERPGIVHRLDKDTSGLMLIAKKPKSLIELQKKFQNREIKKTYITLSCGKLKKENGEIVGWIGRDPGHRRKQISRPIYFDFEPGKKRESKTTYQVLRRFKYKNDDLTLVEATLETGRMHQIRVHFKSIGYPIIGDQIYNNKHSRIISKRLNLLRQFLHASSIKFDQYEFTSSLPGDLESIFNQLTNAEQE